MSTQHKILIADDDPQVRDVLERFLTEKGYAVSTATGGLEALEMLVEVEPDVLLLDIEMPDLNGLEVLRRILAGGIDAEVIMVSGYDDEEACRMAIRLGAADFVTKPMDLDYLNLSLQAKLLAVAN